MCEVIECSNINKQFFNSIILPLVEWLMCTSDADYKLMETLKRCSISSNFHLFAVGKP